MYVESDNESDKDFAVGSEDLDTSDSDADLSLSNDDEEDVEPRTAGDWVFITDPYNDASPPSFDFAPVCTDVHPAVELESLRSPLECFLAFVPERLITYLCDYTNKRTCSYFTDDYSDLIGKRERFIKGENIWEQKEELAKNRRSPGLLLRSPWLPRRRCTVAWTRTSAWGCSRLLVCLRSRCPIHYTWVPGCQVSVLPGRRRTMD
ncbi:UNVERIFIED_CONTAM: hypothetical protein FKN15_039463 [Acipenser sinensis]